MDCHFLKYTDIEYVTAIFQGAFGLLNTFMFYPENELFHQKKLNLIGFFQKKGLLTPF
jgi:hypothetical protein